MPLKRQQVGVKRKRTHYFARSEDSSFNIANIIEDLIDSIVGFTFRYIYTTGMLLWSPRIITFHILTRNRRLRVTRPYSYFFASILFLAVAIAAAADEETSKHLESLFPASADLGSILLEEPDSVKLFLSLGPVLFLGSGWRRSRLRSP